MKVAVIITAYNYERYIAECIESVFAQGIKNLRAIIVDDGSSDNTLKVLENLAKKFNNLVIISQENKGQLGAFNIAFREIKDDEIIFFMDADDVMNQNYISRALEIYQNNPDIGAVFCDLEHFNSEQVFAPKPSEHEYGELGFSLFRTYFLREYLGHSTSSISARFEVLSKILPLDLENEWKIRADDCIIYGASLIGANIYHLNFVGIKYRIHGKNNHFNKDFNNAYLFARELKIERLFNKILNKNDIFLSTQALYLEFLSNKNRKKYLKIALLFDMPFFRKIKLIYRILLKK